MRKNIFAILVFLCLGFWAKAQISVEAPRVVGVNEQFNITFTLSEKPSEFDWSPSDAFQLVWGPQTGSSTSISIINGKHKRESRYTYTYVLLPRQSGAFNLPAARAVVDGKEVYSKTPSIEVVGDGANAQQSQPQSQSQQGGNVDRLVDTPKSASRGGRNDDIFMKLSLSRTSAVVGEPITATLKLYTRSNVAGFEDAKFPTFNGFWAQEIETPQNITFQRENVDDRIYNSALLRKWVIIPQKTGDITIEAAELVCLLQQRISTGNSIFDGFFDDYQTIRKRVVTASPTIKVSALPAGAPASFTGAVGQYKISAKLSSDSLKVHDAASLIVTVSGRGNVALVGAPKVNFPPDSELYDTKTSDRMDAGSGGTSGSKTFEYPFIPRSHGDFEIPAIEFSYYDVSARKYVTLSTKALPYHVERGAASDYAPAEGVNIPVSNRKDVKNLSDDIHYISTRMPQLSSNNVFFVGTPLFWAFVALSILAALMVYGGVSYYRKRNGDIVQVRTRGASKAARKRLATAGDYMKKGIQSAYYEELHRALLGYASDKLNIAAGDLNKESIASAMIASGASQQAVDDYVALLDGCEFARYAPSQSSEAVKESYDKAVDVISVLDSSMKKKVSGGATLALVALLLSFGAAGSAQAQNAYVDSLWTAGVEAYAHEDYAAAAMDFKAIESLGLSSPELYTNIADANFKSMDYAGAILYYERALKLDPSFKDARYNLEIARAHTQDRIESVPEFFVKTWQRKLCYSLSSNQWTALFAATFLLLLAMIVAFFLSRSGTWKKISFFSAIVALILSALTFGNALSQKKDFENRDAAIVTRAVSAAKSSPSAAGGADLFILHEGTKVKVLDSVGDWMKIMIADGREAWIQASDITLI